MKSGLGCSRIIAVLFLSLLGACQTAYKASWDMPAGVKALEANGYPIAYVEKGSGPTVVLVHGALFDYRTWAPQLDSLAENFRVVAISLRHYFPEPWKGDGDFSLKLHANDVAAFIERLGVGPVFLVGWSRGGAVAADTAWMRPDLVRKLVLMDASLYSLVPPPAGSPSDDPRVKRAKATEVYFRRGDMEGGLQFFIDDMVGAGTWSKLREEWRQPIRDNAWTIVGQLGDVETVTCDDIGRFKMPVLLIEGEQSGPVFRRVRTAIQKCLPAARLATIPKAAHQMHEMNPAGFNAALAKFLSE